MVVFRTYEFPVRLTEDQREQLTRILNRQDVNISMLSRKVESMIGEGRTLPEIEQQLTARYRGSVTSVSRPVRSRGCSLVPRLPTVIRKTRQTSTI